MTAKVHVTVDTATLSRPSVERPSTTPVSVRHRGDLDTVRLVHPPHLRAARFLYAHVLAGRAVFVTANDALFGMTKWTGSPTTRRSRRPSTGCRRPRVHACAASSSVRQT